MDRLQCVQAFIEVARTKSFSTAASQLGTSKGTVTKRVAALEAELGVQLINRNSKYVSLTEAGATLLTGGSRLIGEFEALSTEVRGAGSNMRGTIRIGTPPGFGNDCLAPAVAEFLKREPDIRVWIVLETSELDLLRDGLDVLIRTAANLASSSEISKLLGRSPLRLVASPGYLARHGTPSAPKDLEGRNCLLNIRQSATDIWRFHGPDGDETVHVAGNLKSDSGPAIRQVALEDHGLAALPAYLIDDDVRAGRLIEVVMPGYELPTLSVSAIYSTRVHLPARVRVFLDFLKEWFKSENALGR